MPCPAPSGCAGRAARLALHARLLRRGRRRPRPALSDRLERAAGRTPPFPLALRGGGQFGHGRALWAGAAGDVATLRLLAGRAEAAARKAGVETGEHRRYRPHLTLARGRGPVDVREHLRALDAFAGAPGR
ncbi:hypothetical protein DN402_19580 [Streptomyces sp. SW4]|nr:hypothetical protein DN402_19580 [Streptomyces sp. SW4]